MLEGRGHGSLQRGMEDLVFEAAWKLRFSFLPLTLAISFLVVGGAGYLATAGAPRYSRPTVALADIAFAAPPPKPEMLVEAPLLVADEAAPSEPPLAAAVLADPPPRPSSPASPPTSSAVTVAAASGSSPARALDLPTALPTVEATFSPTTSLPATAIKGRDQTATPVSTPVGEATAVERRIVTVASTTPSATAIVPRDQRGPASQASAPGQPNSGVAPKAGRTASATPSPTRSTDDERGKDDDREKDDRDD